MPRCACDTDAKRPCTKRAAQRVLARFVNALIASKMRSTMPSAGRSHLLTSGHAAQEQCQLPHAITMATHTARGVYSQEHKSNGSEAERVWERARATQRTSQAGCRSKRQPA